MLSLRARTVSASVDLAFRNVIQARCLTIPPTQPKQNSRPPRAKRIDSSQDKIERLPASSETSKPMRRSPQYIRRKMVPRLADKPMSLMTLADLSPAQISTIIKLSLAYKAIASEGHARDVRSRLEKESVALIFNKRSTRTRVASETAITALGGSALFLGKDDIQLGVNESLEDTARIIGSMTAGIMARVGEHVEVEVSLLQSLQSLVPFPELSPNRPSAEIGFHSIGRPWPTKRVSPSSTLCRIYGILPRFSPTS